VNLDFESEADAMQKMRVATGIGPILNALFANSPISDGKPNGYLSYRGHIWTDTDNSRSGILPFVFNPRSGFEDYVLWALDVPMYFVKRRGHYHDLSGIPFRRFWKEGAAGLRATVGDFALHLSTLFPEVRMKKYIEVRGCDCGSLPMIAALGPLCRGFLHDAAATAATIELTAGASFADRQRLADEVPRAGLAARIGGRTVGDLARELVAIAKAGLSRVHPEAVSLLAPLEQIAASGRTQSDAIVAIWRETGGDPAKAIPRLAHPGLGG